MGVNLATPLRQWALRDPDRVALVDYAGARREHSYDALDRWARAFASRLRSVGVEPRARVALCAENGAAFTAAFMGIAYAGATVVPVPILSAAPEVAHRMRHGRCALLMHDAPRADLAAASTAIEDVPTLALEAIDPEAAGGPSLVDAPEDLPADAVAVLLYTSGTTGQPKGACITHASLMTHTAALVHHVLGMGEDEVVYAGLPLTHSYGLRMAMLAPWYAGGRAVTVPRFDARRALSIARAERVTWLPAVPTMLAAFCALEDDDAIPALPALRWCLSAGAPLPEALRLAAGARLGAPVRQGYGLTEATFTAIDAPPDPPTPGASGRPVWGVEVRIVDEAGEALERGGIGEVVIRGQNVMAGYLDDPEATREAFRGGWLHTGDVGKLDRAGVLHIVDRKKDLILRGGNNVYPSEVEAALSHHPDVAEVAVVGAEDTYYGEEVVAVVRASQPASPPSTDDLEAHCRARLSAYKIPRRWVFVDAMPLGPSGKVMKRELKQAIADGIRGFQGGKPRRRPSTPDED